MNRPILILAALAVGVVIVLAVLLLGSPGRPYGDQQNPTSSPPGYDTTGGQDMRPRWRD